MAVAAEKLGFKEIYILKGGLDGFKEHILNFTPITHPSTIDEEYRNRFRMKAQIIIPVLIKNSKPGGPVKNKMKRVIGGC
jgi:hypothetical protein